MEKIVRLLRSKSVALFFVLLGLGVTLFFGLRVLHAFRHMPPLPPRPPKPVEIEGGIRPWMNLQYIAKVYAVPPDYLVHYLNLPPLTKMSRSSLEELNQELALGTDENGTPLIIPRLELAIQEFHAHPDFRQTHVVSSTMSLHFIAIESDLSEATLFEALGLPQAGNEYTPLDDLSLQFNAAGSSEVLVQEVQRLLDAREED
jgi:hypothetical protein